MKTIIKILAILCCCLPVTGCVTKQKDIQYIQPTNIDPVKKVTGATYPGPCTDIKNEIITTYKYTNSKVASMSIQELDGTPVTAFIERQNGRISSIKINDPPTTHILRYTWDKLGNPITIEIDRNEDGVTDNKIEFSWFINGNPKPYLEPNNPFTEDYPSTNNIFFQSRFIIGLRENETDRKIAVTAYYSDEGLLELQNVVFNDGKSEISKSFHYNSDGKLQLFEIRDITKDKIELSEEYHYDDRGLLHMIESKDRGTLTTLVTEYEYDLFKNRISETIKWSEDLITKKVYSYDCWK